MPFKSERQRRWVHINEPAMAKKWEEHTPKGKKLSKKVKKKKKRKKTRKESFEFVLDEILQVLFEEEIEIQLGQSSNRTKLGSTQGMIKGSSRPKHDAKRPKKKKIKRRSKT